MLSRSSSKVKVIGHSSRSQEENVGKVVGATSSEGFLVVLAVTLLTVVMADIAINILLSDVEFNV